MAAGYATYNYSRSGYRRYDQNSYYVYGNAVRQTQAAPLRRPQVQERLTSQVADTLIEQLHPQGAIVVLEAEHLCMTMRGARAAGAKTQTSALRGSMRKDAKTRAEAMALLRGTD